MICGGFEMKKNFIHAIFIVFLATFMVYPAQASQPEVKVISFAGDVKIMLPDRTGSAECREGMSLKKGTRVMTGRESFLRIGFDRREDNIVVIESGSDVIIKLDGDEKIELVSGEIFALLNGLKRGETFRVRTPCAVCGARGTGWKTSTGNNTTEVTVFDDRTFVRGVNKDGSAMEEEVWVYEGFMRKINKFQKPGKMEKIPDEMLSKLKKRSAESGKKKKSANKDKKKKKKTDKSQNKNKGLFTLLFGKMDKKIDLREKRWNSAMDQKSESRLDEIRSDKKDTDSSTEPRRRFVVTP
jgi:hypothetical protein